MAFMGGSPYNMAREIAEGYVQVTERTCRSMNPGELAQLTHELDRHSRELRGEPTANVETALLQARQRKLMRLRAALSVVSAYRQRSRVKV
jgi:hypothetical protein